MILFVTSRAKYASVIFMSVVIFEREREREREDTRNTRPSSEVLINKEHVVVHGTVLDVCLQKRRRLSTWLRRIERREKRRKNEEVKPMVYTWYERSAETTSGICSMVSFHCTKENTTERIRMKIWLESRLQTYRFRKSSSLLLSFLSSFTTPNHGPSAQHRRLYYMYI